MTERPQSPMTYSGVFVAGIGASAGGVDPLERMFASVPDSNGIAYVVIQHLSPDHRSHMDELLGRKTTLPIVHIEDGMIVRPDQIYLAPPRTAVQLATGRFRTKPLTLEDGPGHPIDAFFESIAQECGERGIAVVLSGTGSDGSRGVKHVHDAGGLVIVQDSSTAGFDGMPRNARDTGVVDLQTQPEAIPEWIIRYSQDPRAFKRNGIDTDLAFVRDEDTADIFKLVRTAFGIDFSCYRASTITRRMERRIQLTRTRTLSDYCLKLKNDPEELDRLYRDLLVEVTSFFRDKEAFTLIEQQVVPELVARADNRSEIRVWVPGCATGEEAYSLSMLLDYHAAQVGSEADLKVFATDVHATSLETASTGLYSSDTVASIPDYLRERYLEVSEDGFRIHQSLRQSVICARHDITKDPPFTRTDLVSCRNMLIYLEPPVQQQALSLLQFSLKVGGFLFLGPSETLGDLQDDFEVIDQKWRIFRKLRDRNPRRFVPTRPPSRISSRLPRTTGPVSRAEESWVVSEARRQLVKEYVPITFLVNARRELVHTFGDSRHLLELPEGQPTLDISRMLNGQLGTSVSAALHRTQASGQRFTFERVHHTDGKTVTTYRITAEPLIRAPETLYLVSLLPVDQDSSELPASQDGARIIYDADAAADERIQSLERELALTSETLQTTVEELETSNEELQSTNEELVAANEELQSTNEELHSVNEELSTVNMEHQRVIDNLTSSSHDLQAVLSAAAVVVVVMDPNLNIEWFTDSASSELGILKQDVGRPLSHLAMPFTDVALDEMLRRVAETGEAEDCRSRTKSGDEYLIHVQMLTRSDASRHILLRCMSAG